MENFEQNSTDGNAGKDESNEKVTLRLPLATVQLIKEKAVEWNVSQSAAAHRLLSEEFTSLKAGRLVQGATAASANDDYTNVDFASQDEANDTPSFTPGTTQSWNKLSELHDATSAIERRMEEVRTLQEVMVGTLRSHTAAAQKAIQNFASLSQRSDAALRRFDELEKKFLGSFDVQKSTVKEYLDQTHKSIVSAAFEGYDHFEERADKKLRAAERLIERADQLDSSFANYFSSGVQHFLPEVERLKGTLENELKRYKLFHGISLAIGGVLFLLGIAAVTYYRPTLELWDKSQVATAATKSVTEAYAKELMAAQKKAQDLELQIEGIRVAERRKAQEEVENYRIKVFESQAKRYLRELEDAATTVGSLKRKLAANCRFFCFGDFSE